jgi:hypothetical protein
LYPNNDETSIERRDRVDRHGREARGIVELEVEMNKNTYNWLTNLAIVLGVASALFYDSSRVPHSASIALAVIAGMLAAGVYLYNQFLRTRATKVDDKLLGNAKIAAASQGVSSHPSAGFAVIGVGAANDVVITAAPSELHTQAIEALVEAEINLAVQRELADRQKKMLMMLEAKLELEQTKRAANFLEQFLAHSAFARGLRYNFQGKKFLMTPEVELSPKEAALCITEIIRRVSSDETMKGWEYHVDHQGLHLSEARSLRHFHRGADVDLGRMDYILSRSEEVDEEDIEEEKAW